VDLSAGARLFLAVTPPPAAVADLARAVEPLRAVPGGPHWTPPERWHLTLLFLGTVAGERVAPLRAAAGAAVAGSPPMTLRLAGGGWFGSRRRPQVAWAGVVGDTGPLTELAGRLAGAARSLRLPVEDRPFRAHLTVGRWRPREAADGDLLDRLADYRGPSWPVTAVQLLRSHLGPAPRYEEVDAWPVG
jgi:2'-5' RNA ligase